MRCPTEDTDCDQELSGGGNCIKCTYRKCIHSGQKMGYYLRSGKKEIKVDTEIGTSLNMGAGK